MKGRKDRCDRGLKTSENRILLVFLLNLIFSFVEVWGSAVTGSIIIFSDAIHDFGDCVALGIAWWLEVISKRKPDERYHFGYRRFSVVAGLVNNLILLTGGVIIIVTSVQRLRFPREIDGHGMFWFAVVGIVLNAGAMLLTSKGETINEKTISTHMLEDVLTWVAVLVVGGVMCFVNIPALDPLLSMGMTVVIFIGVGKNLKQITAIITMRSPLEKEQYQRLRRKLERECAPATVEAVRLFVMDTDDIKGEILLCLCEDISPEEHRLLLKRVRECCEAYHFLQPVVQIRYEE